MRRQKGKFGELLKRRWGRLRFQYSILCGVTSVKRFVQMVVGQSEERHGGLAREITRRMPSAIQIDPLPFKCQQLALMSASH